MRLAASGLWILGVFAMCVRDLSEPFPFGRIFQYLEQIKELPWNIDWSKPFYERTYAPSNGPYHDSFAEIEEQYVGGFDQSEQMGEMVTTTFPNQTVLYLNSAISAVDAAYLRELFWQHRWRRYLTKLSLWVLKALGPPTVLLRC